MDSAELSYDPKTDLWYDGEGNAFVRNLFDPGNPLYVNISTDCWKGDYKGLNHHMDWAALPLPDGMKQPLKQAVQAMLKTRSLAWLRDVRLSLQVLAQDIKPHWRTWNDVSILDWQEIWTRIQSPHKLSTLRALYRNLVEMKS